MVQILFEEYNLQLTCLVFHFQFTSKKRIKRIAKYLALEFGVTSNLVRSDSKEKCFMEILEMDFTTRYRLFAEFIVNPEQPWEGIELVFSGHNAQQFYNLSKDKLLDWDIFDFERISLHRMEISYQIRIRPKYGVRSLRSLRADLKKRGIQHKYESNLIYLRPKNASIVSKMSLTRNGRALKFQMVIQSKSIAPYETLLFLGYFNKFEEEIIETFFFEILRDAEYLRS